MRQQAISIWELKQRGQKRVIALYLAVVAGIYGIAGAWDYQAERDAECLQKHMIWEPEQDICLPLPTTKQTKQTNKAPHHATSQAN